MHAQTGLLKKNSFNVDRESFKKNTVLTNWPSEPRWTNANVRSSVELTCSSIDTWAIQTAHRTCYKNKMCLVTTL